MHSTTLVATLVAVTLAPATRASEEDTTATGADRWAAYLPPVGSPASPEGFWRGVLTRDGASQVVEIEINRDDDGLSAACTVPDWFGWPAFDLPEPTFDDGVLSITLPYRLECELLLDDVYGELIGIARGPATAITAHLKRAYKEPRPRVRREEIVVDNGDVRVAGTLVIPDAPGPHPVVVYVHGRGRGSRGNDVYVHQAVVAAEAGLGGFVYDKRGVGASTGDFDTANLHDHAADAAAIIGVLARRRDVDAARVGLHGASAGGWVCTIAAARHEPRPAFLVTKVGPFESVYDQQWHVAESYMSRRGFTRAQIDAAIAYTCLESGEDESPQAVRRMREGLELARREGWDTLIVDPPTTIEQLRRSWARVNRYDPADDLRRLDMPILAFFGEDDYVVDPRYNVPKLEEAAREIGNDDVTIVVLRGMDHGLENPVQLRTFPGDRASRYYFLWNRIGAGYGETLIAWLHDRLAP